jgi:hypothetical protein
METARESARKESACDLHQEDDLPYRMKALYAGAPRQGDRGRKEG